MNTIFINRDDILTSLRAHTMMYGVPFALTEKLVFSAKEQSTFDMLYEKLHALKQDFIAKRDLLARDEKESCAIKAVFSEEELGMLLTIFEAVSKENPLGNDMDLRMHVPSREAFDSLHGRLKQLSQS